MAIQTPINITLEQVRTICGKYIGRLAADATPEEAYEFVGLSMEGVYLRSIVTERLFSRIQNAFEAGHKAIHRHIRKLLDQLVFEHYVYDAALEPTFGLLTTIRDAVNCHSYGQPVGNFEAAAEAAADYIRWTGIVSENDHLMHHRETIAMALAVRKLRKKFAAKSDDIGVLKVKQATVVDRMARCMGGMEIAIRLFKTLGPKWDPQQERYHDVLEMPLGTQPLIPRIPTNYLLSLAVKHPYAKKPMRRSDADWYRLVQESSDFAAIYKVQPTSYLDTTFLDHHSLLDQLVKKALEDSLFRLHQQRPSDIPWVLKTLVECCTARNYVDHYGRTDLISTVAVIEAIQRHIGDMRGPTVFRVSDVECHCPSLQADEVGLVLRERLSHPPGTCNQKFVLPDEVPDDALPREQRCGPNFAERPLVALEEDRYWMVDHAVCAPAFVEVLLSHLRDLNVSDEKIGLAFEDLVGRLLAKHGIRSVSGKYKDSGKTWECDLVFETADRVFFLETKKKSLTRKSRAGMTLGVLLDIGQSMVHSVLQGLRHERKLRKDQRLSLESNDGKTYEIELAGREIEVLAVTLQDFGGFHDRIFLDRALAAQTILTFCVDIPSYENKVSELNKHIEELRDLVSELTDLREWRRGIKMPTGEVLGGAMPFMNCWFLGLPHIMVVLDGVSDAAGFQKSLFITRQMTFQASDFYFDRMQSQRYSPPADESCTTRKTKE